MMRVLVVNVPHEGDDNYDRGDIVDTRPDDLPWGRQEHPSTRSRTPTKKFVCLEVDDAPKEARQMGDPITRDPEDVGILGHDSVRTVRKSRSQVDLRALSDEHDLRQTVRISWDQFRSYLTDRAGGTDG